MIALIEKLIKTNIIAQLFKFCGVGVINTIVDFGLFQLLIMAGAWLGAGEWFIYVAQTVSYLLAVLCSYILNKYWTFNAANQKKGVTLVKMYLLSGVGFCILQSLLWVFSGVLAIRPEILAKLCATVPVTIVNFLGTKFWVFREKRHN